LFYLCGKNPFTKRDKVQPANCYRRINPIRVMQDPSSSHMVPDHPVKVYSAIKTGWLYIIPYLSALRDLSNEKRTQHLDPGVECLRYLIPISSDQLGWCS